MPSITTVHESLPYVDEPPTESQIAAASLLIAQERSLVPDDPNHALLPPPPSSSDSPYLTPILSAEFSRLQSSPDPKTSKLQALDLSRYSSLPTPPANPSRETLAEALSEAYTSQAYISARRTNLALLDTYGKNAWLVGNYHLEGELKALEKELADTKREIDLLTLQRKAAQDQAGPELIELEKAWKAGVGRVLETEAAAEGLRRQALEQRRRLAQE
ncbi:Pre-mRNA-splicing factor SPF27 [Cladorrhinum samala]|uniref:Pre-mRNA-splicing factor SPF27 n=1 Tax=Cladorrhinum samala TaxID=585594 RepID=A0AAV9HMZ3_9PEZI|nr:Pre-mRNA-splicing factor SPF27 [Cladorrhinum samala]